jgi:hypothetical protein
MAQLPMEPPVGLYFLGVDSSALAAAAQIHKD